TGQYADRLLGTVESTGWHGNVDGARSAA
ncbi:MAG: hypothetical protein QOF95_1416, partial [Pseudonocardiales bacterium]|nr:hypothetical protein [Pseudonocardiales bacterium]